MLDAYLASSRVEDALRANLGVLVGPDGKLNV